jgi:hypothetical protein
MTFKSALSNLLVEDEPIYKRVISLVDAPVITFNASLANEFTVTIAGNRTLGAPTNPADGQKVTLRIKQDAVGNRTLTFDPIYRFGTDIPSVVLSTTPDAEDYIGIIYNLDDDKWDVVALSRGF